MKKKFMKQISVAKMSDTIETKEAYLEELNKKGKKERKLLYWGGIAIIIAMAVCLCAPSVNLLAQSVIGQIKTTLNLNGDPVETGDSDKFDIDIPDDCEKAVYDLLYRQIDGPSITLAKDETINISSESGKAYAQVGICKIGETDVSILGGLDGTSSCSFTADVAGEYVIYDLEKGNNVTGEVSLEHEGISYYFLK